MPTEDVDPRRAVVRPMFEAGDLSLAEIARRAGVHARTLGRWAVHEGWQRNGSTGHSHDVVSAAADAPSVGKPSAPVAVSNRKSPAPARKVAVKRRTKRGKVGPLLDRVYRLIQRNLEIMEARMSDDDSTNTTANPERDLRAVGALVRSVEKMKELEPDQSKREPVVAGRYPLTPEEEDRLRDEIVENLLRLRER